MIVFCWKKTWNYCNLWGKNKFFFVKFEQNFKVKSSKNAFFGTKNIPNSTHPRATLTEKNDPKNHFQTKFKGLQEGGGKIFQR